MLRIALLPHWLLVCVTLICVQPGARAQSTDSMGDEFLLAFLPNLAAGLPTIELQLTSSVATSVTFFMSQSFTTPLSSPDAIQRPLGPQAMARIGATCALSTSWVLPLETFQIPSACVLAFGTERSGLTDELRARADACVSLPMEPGVSSLNLATSVSVVLYAWRLSRA